MTSNRNEVSKEVFSSRLVVPSISPKTFAKPVYGILAEHNQVEASNHGSGAYGCPNFHPPSMSTSFVFNNIASTLCTSDV